MMFCEIKSKVHNLNPGCDICDTASPNRFSRPVEVNCNQLAFSNFVCGSISSIPVMCNPAKPVKQPYGSTRSNFHAKKSIFLAQNAELSFKSEFSSQRGGKKEQNVAKIRSGSTL